MPDRRQESYAVRLEAAELARSRNHPPHQANGDEEKYAGDRYFMSFTKGLPHDPETGLLYKAQDFVEFRRAIDDGFIDPFSDRVRHGAIHKVENGKVVSTLTSTNPQDMKDREAFRQWEAPTAGVAYELQGPDAQAVTMPPAPPLLTKEGKTNPELIFEMFEVYELAILRDQPLNTFDNVNSTKKMNSTRHAIEDSITHLNQLDYLKNQTGRPRKVNMYGELDAQTIFRGSSPGVDVGPYLSQFLLIGNDELGGGNRVVNGKIAYGVLQIDQRVPIAAPQKDYMTEMPSYVSVQRGIKPKDQAGNNEEVQYLPLNDPQSPRKRRFISTPRDLATYVHFDALYEAYLNACNILLGMQTPFDPAFDHLSGGGAAAGNAETRRQAGGFALYGGPHILNLVTEVATRALKAVRFQKFNNHLRLRPEALAAKIELARRQPESPNVPQSLRAAMQDYIYSDPANPQKESPTLADIKALTSRNNATEKDQFMISGEENYFLPMAFPEGSPMHPSYGAGHATVAGACVTILKAFFDTSSVLVKPKDGSSIKFKRQEPEDQAVVFRAPPFNPNTFEPMMNQLDMEVDPNYFLTLEGELNKLAANISIGRNMAGVHFFSDYYDSLRMGEQIAIAILEEQALTYPTDPFVLSIPTFDGDVVRIGRR